MRGTVPCYCVHPKIKPGLIVIFTPEDPLGLSSGDVLFFHVQKFTFILIQLFHLLL